MRLKIRAELKNIKTLRMIVRMVKQIIIKIKKFTNGLGSKRKMKGVSLLAQTYGHPNYLGIKGSKALLDILNKKLILGLDLKKLDKEIKELEKEIEDEDVEIVEEDTNLMFNPRETRYIG